MKIKTHYFTVFTGPPLPEQSLLTKDSNAEYYGGNPAGVRLVEALPTNDEHQGLLTSNIAHSTITMVYIKAITKQHFAIRWFNHHKTIQRCGHGTLAAAAYIHHYQDNINKSKVSYQFSSDIETLEVLVDKEMYSISLPMAELQASHALAIKFISKISVNALRVSHTQEENGYIIIELPNSAQVKQFECDKNIIECIGQRALIITAKNHLPSSDITFRYFAPQYGQIEDIATGSAGAILWPFWQETSKSSKDLLRCTQLSKTGGYLELKQKNKREVIVSGKVKALKND